MLKYHLWRFLFLLLVSSTGSGLLFAQAPTLTNGSVTAYQGGENYVGVNTLGTSNPSGIGRVVTGPTAPSGLGLWQYKVGSKDWTEVPETGVIVLNAGDLFRFLVQGEPKDGDPAPSITMYAWTSENDVEGGVSYTALGNFSGLQGIEVSSDAATLTATVVANTAPTLVASPVLLTISEDTEISSNTGFAVSGLGTASDTEQITALGRAVLNYDEKGKGAWQYAEVINGVWKDFPAPITVELFLLNAQAYIRFVPNENVNTQDATEQPTLTFHAWDGTKGTAYASNEGSAILTAISSQSASISLTITPVNDPPTLEGNFSLTIDEDPDPTSNNGALASSLGTASDPEESNPDNIGRVVTSFDEKDRGDFQYEAGGIWTSIPPLNDKYFPLEAGNSIRFHPDQNANTGDNDLPTITVLAWDGTQEDAHVLASQTDLLGSISFFPLTGTVTINAVNDPPKFPSGQTFGLTEDENDYAAGKVLTAWGGAIDPESSNGDIGRVVLAVNTVNGGTDHGVFQYRRVGGDAWNDIVPTNWEAAHYLLLPPGTKIRFSPTVGFDDFNTDGFTLSITLLPWDVTLGDGYGQATLAELGTSVPSGTNESREITFSVRALNDRPILADSPNVAALSTLTEDVSATDNNGLLVSAWGTAEDVEQGTTIGRVVTSFDEKGKGDFQYKAGGNWKSIPSLGGQDFPLAANTRIRFQPNHDANTGDGNFPTISFVAWDQEEGTAHSLNNRSSTHTAISTNTQDHTITIASVGPKISTLTPSSGSVLSNNLSELVIVFDESVETYVANTIHVYQGDELVHTFVSSLISISAPSYTEATLSLPASVFIPKNTALNVRIDKRAFKERGATTYGGFVDSTPHVNAGSVSSANPTFWTFNTGATNPPRLLSSTPENGATNVSLDQVVSLTFDENIRLPSPHPQIQLGGVSTQLSVTGATLSITPTNNLDEGVEITVQIPAGAIIGSSSNQSSSDAVNIISFTTVALPAFDPTKTSPSPSTTGVSPTVTTLKVAYTRDIQIGSGNLYIDARKTDGTSGYAQIHTIPISSPSNALTISSSEPEVLSVNLQALGITLSGTTSYQIRIDEGVVTGSSVNRNKVAALSERTWIFSTTVETVPSSPEVIQIVNPPSPYTNLPPSGTISIAFNEPVEKSTDTPIPNLIVYVVVNEETDVFRTIPITDDAVSVSGREITLKYDNSVTTSTLDEPLPGGNTFFIALDEASLRDYDGNGIEAVGVDANLRFTTQSGSDNVPPSVTSLFLPAVQGEVTDLNTRSLDASVDVAGIQILYSEPVYFEQGQITIRSGGNCTNGTELATISSPDFVYSHARQRVSLPFNNTTPLDNNTRYTLCLPQGLFNDQQGNLSGAQSHTFRTRLTRPKFVNTRVSSTSTVDTVVLELNSASFTENTGAFTAATSNASTPFVFSTTSEYQGIANPSQVATTYGSLRWKKQTGAQNFSDISPNTHSSATLNELLGKTSLTRSDIGIYTYYVWQEGTRSSDTTLLLLVILEKDKVRVYEQKQGSTSVTELDDPIILPTRTSSSYDLSLAYYDGANDGANYGFEWSVATGVTYNSNEDPDNDSKTSAFFTPSSFRFSNTENVRSVSVSVRLTNNNTGHNYLVSRGIVVSNENALQLLYLPISVTDPPDASNVKQGICQESGAYSLVELVGDAYELYTNAYLLQAVATFTGISSEVANFVQRPVGTISTWRLNSDIGFSISGSTDIDIRRRYNVLDEHSQVIAEGGRIASVTVYQAPTIVFQNVGNAGSSKYCASEDSNTPIRLLVSISGGVGQDRILYSGLGEGATDVAKGAFRLYAKEKSSDAYPQTPDSTAVAYDFHLNPSALYTDLANNKDSVLIRLEYASDAEEDVSGNDCIGRKYVDFTIYKQPPPPVFDYGSATQHTVGGITEVVYCEGEADIQALAVAAPQADEQYSWYPPGDNTSVASGVRYAPPSSDFSANISGRETRPYIYRASRTKYVQSGFGGCESLNADFRLQIIGEPEVSIQDIEQNISGGGVGISNDAPEVCVGGVDATNFVSTELEFLITARNDDVIPIDGDFTFSGPGIVSNTNNPQVKTEATPRPPGSLEAIFNPLLAIQIQDPNLTIETFTNQSSVTISYQWTNVYGEKSCPATVTKEIIIHSLPHVSFNSQKTDATGVSLNSGNTNLVEACVNEPVFTLSQENSDQNPRFYIDGTLSSTVGTVDFSADAVRKTYVTNSGGDVGRYQFVGATEHTVTYFAEDRNGCRNLATKNIHIFSVPELDFSPNNGCDATNLRLQAEVKNESALNGIESYEWSRGSESLGAPSSDSDKQITDQLGLGGAVHMFTLEVVTAKQCVQSITKPVDIGLAPEPKIAWEGATVDREILFKLHDAALGVERIGEVEFSVESESGNLIPGTTIRRENIPSEEYLQDMSYTFPNAGVYNVVFQVTSKVNCEQSTRQKIHVLPLKTVTQGGEYRTGFEDGDELEGWHPETLIFDIQPTSETGKLQEISVDPRPNSWTLGVLEASNTVLEIPNESVKAWFTKQRENSNGVETMRHTYLAGERSWVYTPAFNLSNLSKPTVEFNLAYELKNQEHGLVFQYSTDDGRNWIALGNYSQQEKGTGLDWYTHEEIDGDPGQQSSRRVGWATSSNTKWLLARHKLDPIPVDQRGNVRFRIALGALNDGDVSSNVWGAGFDNFWIGSRERVILIEEFSTEVNTEAKKIHETITNYLNGQDEGNNPNYQAAQEEEAVRISYYGFPKDNPNNERDRNYQINPEDVNTRQLFYGVTDAPEVILGGQLNQLTGTAKDEVPFSLNQLNKDVLRAPEFSVAIQLNPEQDGKISMTIETALTDEGLRNNRAGEYRLYVAVVEKQVEMENTPNGQTIFEDIMRKMLPSAGGTPLIFSNNKDLISTDVTWKVFSSYLSIIDPTKLDLRAVAFVQKDNYIYQVATEPIVLENIFQLAVKEVDWSTDLQVYPNPADKELHVVFGTTQPAGLVYQLVDDAARIVLKDELLVPKKHIILDISSLDQGIYILNLQPPDNPRVVRRIFKLDNK